MWSYYGSKSRVVDLYPPPKTDKIIEPFCGSAKYSLKYWNKQVLLMDKYSVIVDLWNWLQKQSRKEILSLPQLKKGDDIRLFDLPKEAKYLIGFCINRGSKSPRNVVTEWGQEEWAFKQRWIADNLYKIKHWEIVQGSYEDLPNENATWFIDPPYKFGGEHYKENTIDFDKLADWCKSRNGQVIVCENTKADWLDFKPMKKMKGQRYKTTEAIWSNMPTNYDNVQQTLF